MKNLFWLITALLLMSACSMFSPVKTETATTYLINASPSPSTKRPNGHINLLVSTPSADSIYDTTDIAYTTRPYQIGYFVKSNWAQPPTQMLQPLLIQTLRKTRYFHEVSGAGGAVTYNFMLNTHLVKLQQDYSRWPHQLHFVLRAELIDLSTSHLVASKEFAVHEIIPQNDTYAGVVVTNQAAAQLLRQVAAFCLRNARS